MIKNRDWVIVDNENGINIIAECPHCNEPITIEFTGKLFEKPDGFGSLAEIKETITKIYCRGSSGLSYYTRCCYELNCIKKIGNLCDLKPKSKDIYEVNKTWSVIVVEKSTPNLTED